MYEYKVTTPHLLSSADRTTPVMDHEDMEDWLHDLGINGWELISYGARHWKGSTSLLQEWWVFKRPRNNKITKKKRRNHMNIYLINEDGVSFCIKAKTMADAIKVCEQIYLKDREEEIKTTITGTKYNETDEKNYYHEQILQSCSLVSELKN